MFALNISLAQSTFVLSLDWPLRFAAHIQIHWTCCLTIARPVPSRTISVRLISNCLNYLKIQNLFPSWLWKPWFASSSTDSQSTFFFPLSTNDTLRVELPSTQCVNSLWCIKFWGEREREVNIASSLSPHCFLQTNTHSSNLNQIRVDFN